MFFGGDATTCLSKWLNGLEFCSHLSFSYISIRGGHASLPHWQSHLILFLGEGVRVQPYRWVIRFLSLTDKGRKAIDQIMSLTTVQKQDFKNLGEWAKSWVYVRWQETCIRKQVITTSKGHWLQIGENRVLVDKESKQPWFSLVRIIKTFGIQDRTLASDPCKAIPDSYPSSQELHYSSLAAPISVHQSSISKTSF